MPRQDDVAGGFRQGNPLVRLKPAGPFRGAIRKPDTLRNGQDNQLWFFGDLPAEGISKAKAEAVKGLEIDDKLADAQLGLCT